MWRGGGGRGAQTAGRKRLSRGPTKITASREENPKFSFITTESVFLFKEESVEGAQGGCFRSKPFSHPARLCHHPFPVRTAGEEAPSLSSRVCEGVYPRSSGAVAAPLWTSDGDALTQHTPPPTGQEGTGVWPALPRPSRNARRKMLLQAADRGRRTKRGRIWGGRGRSSMSRGSGRRQAPRTTPPETLSAPARCGGGRRDRRTKPSWHRFHVPSPSSLTPPSSPPPSAAASSGL